MEFWTLVLGFFYPSHQYGRAFMTKEFPKRIVTLSA